MPSVAYSPESRWSFPPPFRWFPSSTSLVEWRPYGRQYTARPPASSLNGRQDKLPRLGGSTPLAACFSEAHAARDCPFPTLAHNTLGRSLDYMTNQFLPGSLSIRNECLRDKLSGVHFFFFFFSPTCRGRNMLPARRSGKKIFFFLKNFFFFRRLPPEKFFFFVSERWDLARAGDIEGAWLCLHTIGFVYLLAHSLPLEFGTFSKSAQHQG